MNKKQLLFTLLLPLLFTVFIIGLIIFVYKQENNIDTSLNETINHKLFASEDYSPECVSKITKNEDSGRYAIIKDICVTGLVEVDESIKETIDKIETNFIQAINEPEIMLLSNKFLLNIKTEQYRFGRIPEIMSIKLIATQHINSEKPIYKVYTWSFDRRNKEIINFEDIFLSDEDSIKALYSLIKNQLLSLHEINENTLNQYIDADNINNYQNFMIKGDRIIFIFDSNLNDSQSAEPISAEIIFEDVQSLLHDIFIDSSKIYINHTPPEPQTLSLGNLCSDADGKWLADHRECENVNRNWCNQMIGSYNECA